ncbi:DUF1667 domain-containing protein [Mycoplasmatota bacterium]|nr:DUF1667 domain-containing protein [Mycoplasmatota bacterium]
MKKELICIACPIGCHLEIYPDEDYRVEGNQCKRGLYYGKKELTNPTRIITSTVAIEGGIYRRIPVVTKGEVPKDLIFDAMKIINKVRVISPIKRGDVIVKNILDTGVDVVASRSM